INSRPRTCEWTDELAAELAEFEELSLLQSPKKPLGSLRARRLEQFAILRSYYNGERSYVYTEVESALIQVYLIAARSALASDRARSASSDALAVGFTSWIAAGNDFRSSTT